MSNLRLLTSSMLQCVLRIWFNKIKFICISHTALEHLIDQFANYFLYHIN